MDRRVVNYKHTLVAIVDDQAKQPVGVTLDVIRQILYQREVQRLRLDSVFGVVGVGGRQEGIAVPGQNESGVGFQIGLEQRSVSLQMRSDEVGIGEQRAPWLAHAPESNQRLGWHPFQYVGDYIFRKIQIRILRCCFNSFFSYTHVLVHQSIWVLGLVRSCFISFFFLVRHSFFNHSIWVLGLVQGHFFFIFLVRHFLFLFLFSAADSLISIALTFGAWAVGVALSKALHLSRSSHLNHVMKFNAHVFQTFVCYLNGKVTSYACHPWEIKASVFSVDGLIRNLMEWY